MNLLKNSFFFPVVNAVAFVVVLTINFLSNYLPINNLTAGELSDLYPNLFVPPGYVFAIWGAIYILQAIFIGYGFTEKGRSNPVFQKIKWLYALTVLLNVSWLLLWHYQQMFASLFVMVTFLASLIYIYLKLDIPNNNLTGLDRLALNIPFSVYFGWISLATIANTTAAIVSVQPDLSQGIQEVATVLILLVVFILTSLMITRNNDWAFGLVVMWASIGITLKSFENSIITVEIAAGALAFMTLGLILINFAKRTSSRYESNIDILNRKYKTKSH